MPFFSSCSRVTKQRSPIRKRKIDQENQHLSTILLDPISSVLRGVSLRAASADSTHFPANPVKQPVRPGSMTSGKKAFARMSLGVPLSPTAPSSYHLSSLLIFLYLSSSNAAFLENTARIVYCRCGGITSHTLQEFSP